MIIMESDKMLKVNTGGRRNEVPLTEQQFAEVKQYAVSLGMPRRGFIMLIMTAQAMAVLLSAQNRY